MCGICGVLNYRTSAPVDRGVLLRMNATLRHRGPDDEGVIATDGAGLAMRRLSIIDVAGGHQPISNEDRTLWTVLNGEIYNYQELRDDLLGRGHNLATHSDTEVIVHQYEEEGLACVEQLDGMFAFALHDARERRLFLARDRLGKKPLYWHRSKNGLLWGSEAKALLAAPWVERRVNALALHHYLTLQYVPDPLTIFEGMHRLPAAHKLIVERGGRGKPRRPGTYFRTGPS